MNNFNKIFKINNWTRTIFFILGDVFFVSLSVLFAFLVRFEGIIPAHYFLNIRGIIYLSSLVIIPVFYFFKLYHFTWAYVSTEELVSLIKGTSLSFLIITGIFFILRDLPIFSGFPRSVLLITYFLIFTLTGLFRFSKRIYFQVFLNNKEKEKERTLIVGAGDAGEQILRSIFSFGSSPYLPIGFVDDSPAKEKKLIHGLIVLGKIKDIPEVAKKHNVESLIIALPSVDSRVIHKAVEKGREAGLRKIKIIPGLEEIISGRVTIGQLREVEMADLLEREQLSLDKKMIEDFIKDKKVLVTGAAGSIGSELCRQIARLRPASLILLDQDETGIFNINRELREDFLNLKRIPLIADIRDKTRIEKIFEEFQPEIVFHAAAYKHVPLMEENPGEAIKNNIFGSENLIKVALNNKVDKFILVSTDKAVNPSSVMGRSKRIAEMIGQLFNQKNQTKFISVRFGNVLDSRGSVIPLFKEKIKKREAIEITHPEMKRYFMTTPEACLLVLQAGAMGQGGEVFVLDMGDPIKIVDLAKELIRLSGLKPDKDIPIVFSQPRPGEKLFEELLTAEEGTVATENQKIFQAKLSQVDEEKLNELLNKLKEVFKGNSKQNMLKLLEEIIKG